MTEPNPDIQSGDDQRDFSVLMIRYLDNQLDSDETATLDEALKQSAELREQFVAVCMHRRLMYGRLGFDLGSNEKTDAGSDEYHRTILSEIIEIEKLERLRGVAASNREVGHRGDNPHAYNFPKSVPEPSRVRQIVIPRAAVWIAAAALVLVSVILLSPLTDSDKPQQSTGTDTGPSPYIVVASVIDSEDAQWGGGETSGRPALGDDVYNQPLELISGSVTLQFHSGAEVTVKGPALIEPVAAKRIRLTQGRLIGYCPTPQSHGFTVDTPNCRVVDTGTEFGVVVQQQDYTECHVFTGHVEVAPILEGGKQAAATQVREGHAVGVTEGEVRLDVALSAERFGKAYIPLIAGLRSDDRYQQTIIPRGLTNGVLAFQDRQYTWLDLPDHVQSADYVLTANQYGERAGYRATLEVSRPATVYVFWHPAIPAPSWLSERFALTDLHVRLGGSAQTEAAMKLYGKPQDLVYQVWRFTMPSAGEVPLGDVETPRQSGGMYAVAVTPIVPEPRDTPAEETP